MCCLGDISCHRYIASHKKLSALLRINLTDISALAWSQKRVPFGISAKVKAPMLKRPCFCFDVAILAWPQKRGHLNSVT